MKKKTILCFSMALVMSAMTPLAAFAETAPAVEAAAAAAAAAPISVSLEDAKKQMNAGIQGELLELGKLGDKVAATSASEGLSSLREAKDAVSQIYAGIAAGFISDPEDVASAYASAAMIEQQISGVNKADVERTKKYAQANLEPNDKARHNALDLQSMEMYYSLKSAEEGLAIVQSSYDVAKTVYDQTQKKYKLGTVSKVDLLAAELDLAEAKDKFTSTENGVKQARMGFNILFGYDLMQQVKLTDSIAVPTMPSITVEDAVASALKNRNEIREAAYNREVADKAFMSVQAYPRNSAKYLSGKVSYLAAKAACDMAPITVEQDVRSQYDAMHANYDALMTSWKSVANAKETLRLTQLQYNAGLITYTTVQQVRMLYESAQLNEASARLTYALAVEKFNMSIDVGTTAAGY